LSFSYNLFARSLSSDVKGACFVLIWFVYKKSFNLLLDWIGLSQCICSNVSRVGRNLNKDFSTTADEFQIKCGSYCGL